MLALIRVMEQGDDPYTSKFKGMGVALRMLTRALDGNYVNLGVFAL